jgi:ABC-type glycerol-3-phosphate transport system substrate-binding protein
MQSRIAVLAAMLAIGPLGARAADLVVWWEKGQAVEEDQAVREIIAAFEQESGKGVELVQVAQSEMLAKAEAALGAGQPPDFLFASAASIHGVTQWAYEDRLVDLAADSPRRSEQVRPRRLSGHRSGQ